MKYVWCTVCNMRHPEVWMPYPEYLKTSHWQKVKERQRKLASGHCQLNSSHNEGKWNVHHRDPDYKSKWHESPFDVIYLCEECHERFHERMPQYNCKGSKYGGLMVIAECKDILMSNNKFEDKQAYIEKYKILIQEAASPDKTIRQSARIKIFASVWELFNIKYDFNRGMRELAVELMTEHTQRHAKSLGDLFETIDKQDEIIHRMKRLAMFYGCPIHFLTTAETEIYNKYTNSDRVNLIEQQRIKSKIVEKKCLKKPTTQR